MTIKGVHALFYTNEPEAAREFLRDKLGLSAYDSGGGWLIFHELEADIGCHPADGPDHGISFYCEDIEATMAELSSREVEFTAPLREEEWGRVTEFELPGGGPVALYEPKYGKPKA
jgi:catechol 2,3-dioxygenase-like lactoylglutathione lyase family enzyme